MSSALKPVLSSGGPQNPAAQMNKPIHTQVPPSNFGQPPSHLPQNLVNAPSPLHNPVHHPNVLSAPNHYALNVPSAGQHYNMPASSHPLPLSHPVPSLNQPFNTSPPKNTNPSYPPNYQPNLGHPPNVPTHNSSAATPDSQEKPQSNGTQDLKVVNKTEQNHVSPEKPKMSPEKPPTPAASLSEDSSNEAKQPEIHSVETPDTCTSDPATPTESQVPDNSMTGSSASSVENKSEDDTSTVESSNVESTEKENHSNVEESKNEGSSSSTGSDTVTTSKSKDQTTQKSTMKLATTPRTPSRKIKPAKAEFNDSPKASKVDKSLSFKAGSVKRTRIKTQPYQCPLPELEIISKMTSSSRRRHRNNDEKLIIFYKNEFLAVRNSEGGFYICRAVQNIYKSSPKIRIRWLSQDKNDKSGELYIPDFYDFTDFDCILTNLNLVRVDKETFKLPRGEKERTDSILKRALAVEKGDATPPSLTEEHPDGLDLSLYKEESQLQKRKGKKRKASSALKAQTKSSSTKKSPDQAKVRKVAAAPVTVAPSSSKSRSKKAAKKKTVPIRKAAPVESKKSGSVATHASVSRSERAKRRESASVVAVVSKTSPVVDHKKAKVLAKVARKVIFRGAVSSAKAPISSKSSSKSSKHQQQPSSQSTSSSQSSKATSKISTRNQPIQTAAASRKPKRTKK